MSASHVSMAISVIFLASSVYLYRNLQRYRQEVAHLTEIIGHKNAELERVYQNFLTQDKNNCAELSAEIELVSVENQKVGLPDIVGEQAQIILVIPKSACNSCFDTAMEEIKLFFEELEKAAMEVIILTHTGRVRETIANFEQWNMNPAVYGLNDSGLSLFAEQGDSPFFFVLDPSLRGKRFFILNRNNPRFNQIYFREILSVFVN